MSLLPDARRKSPTQPRAAATMRAIREAFLEVLRTEGAGALTTNRIAEVAGVSIGSLYQYYRDKHAIAVDICNEALREQIDAVELASGEMVELARRSLDEAIAALVRSYVERERRLYGLLREFYRELHWRYDFESGLIEQHAHHRGVESWLLGLFARHAGQLRIAEPQCAAALVVDVVEGAVHRAIDRHPQRLCDPRFAGELTELVLRYLKN